MSSTIETQDFDPSSRPVQSPEVALQATCAFPALAGFPYKTWVQELLHELAPKATSLAVRFVTDEDMKQFNLQFRGVGKATDVLSFPGETDPEGFHLGDLVIALPWTRRQAAEREVSVSTEIRTLILHGMLHCLGYDHETDDGEMESVEDDLRQKWVIGVD